MQKNDQELVVGFFCGPWHTGKAARDGAVIGFGDIEHAIKMAAAESQNLRMKLVELDISLFLSPNPQESLIGLDVVYANCGPLAAFLFYLRDRHNLKFRIIREVRTLGWIGYIFQEFVARSFKRAGDICSHTSAYSVKIWNKVREDGGDIHYYPMLRQQSSEHTTKAGQSNKMHVAYFSRLSKDKGFGYVPAIMLKLRQAGWPVESLDICGVREDKALLRDCINKLRNEGITVHYHGEVDHRQTMQLMRSMNVVLFPSTSSFEASGRIVAEAYSHGTMVIASEYCTGRDVLTKNFRIPLTSGYAVEGDSHMAFSAGELDLPAWQVPNWDEQNFIASRCERYRYSEERTIDILANRASTHKAVIEDIPDVSMTLHWEEYASIDTALWCEKVHQILMNTYKDRADLLDLGGAMKMAIIQAGFTPRVSFRHEAVAPEEINGAVRCSATV